MDRPDALEAQSIYVLREAMLWSPAKDSNVMIRPARKAFFGSVPLPVRHVDTGREVAAARHGRRGDRRRRLAFRRR
jgi:3'-phosphoadenosine 5'-phosphosulfate sulfotransferase (PAPS reductase)/FAD synthetase